MSRLGDIEDALVQRLSEITLDDDPVFATVRGASGGYRPVIRDGLRRESMPAAYVAFVDEPTAPEIVTTRRGPRFSVLIAARSLRQATDPRHDGDGPGALSLLDRVREALADFSPAEDRVCVCLHEKFVDADDRIAVYELLYQIRAAAEEMPAAPTGLESAPGLDSDAVRLSWDAVEASPSNGIPRFYKIYRKIEGEDAFVLIDATLAESLSRVLASQPIGADLRYYVTSQNLAGEGEPSGTTTITL